jgi:hypothetical protein
MTTPERLFRAVLVAAVETGGVACRVLEVGKQDEHHTLLSRFL